MRALRGVRVFESAAKEKNRSEPKLEVPAPPKPTVNLGESLFGGKPSTSTSVNPFPTPSNPFSTSTSSNSNPFSTSKAPTNPFSAAGLGSASELAAKPPQPPTTTDLPKTFAAALSLNNDSPKFGPPPPPEPWPQESDLPPAYPFYYFVDTDYETLDKVEDVPIPTQAMDLDEGGGSSSQKEDKDVYESTIDKIFQKFADRLAQNPEQVIRYEFKGQPLLYSKKDAVGKLLASFAKENVKVQTKGGSGMPRCGNCGAGRVFEVQLTPHAIMQLESEEISLDGMEWGTIIVGVCEKDCQQRGIDTGAVGYVEEWAGVQWEELNERT